MPADEADHSPGKPNRLIDCSSPYLQQHAHNPVDWYPWGDEALERARREDRPVLLSIGYSACHWCHVMERECFEDPEIARLMNANFVSIKVDREERPDLDELYMRAVQMMTGQGGWPLTVFLTPDRVPFYGGTYFPPEDRGGMPGFPRVLRAAREAFDERRDQIRSAAREIAATIEETALPPAGQEGLSAELLTDAFRSLVQQFDDEQGGFGGGPKFPQAPVLDWLLRFGAERGERRAVAMVGLTLGKMAAGGVYDQIGGGFHRYAVDRNWRVPHFEKMLYDNAQLAALYADAHLATGDESCRRTAIGTADYMLAELRSPHGAFCSAQDADSEGVEGRYYVWTYEEFADCVGPDAVGMAARYCGVSEEGNSEDGTNIPYRPLTMEALAGLFGVDEDEARSALAEARRRLLERRRERAAPARDEKVLADWNALAISGLVHVGRATGDGRYVAAARECAEFVLEELRPQGRLMHTWRNGRAEVPAFLSDHALLAAAMIDLYESTFDVRYLHVAREVAGAMLADFRDPDSGLFHEVGRGGEALIAPVRRFTDQPLPSGNSVAANVLLRLAALGDDDGHREAAERLMNRCACLMRQSPGGTAHMLSAALRYLSAPREFVIVGLGPPAADRLCAVADEFYLPHLTRAGAGPDEASRLAGEIPLLQGRECPDGRPTAYVCSGGACREPVTSPDALREQLRSLAEGGSSH